MRDEYLDALRDWAVHGAASPHVLAEDEARRRVPALTPEISLACAQFRLGQHRWRRGSPELAGAHFVRARELHPASWAFKRQAWNLEHELKSGGPEFWSAVDALGDEPYYPPPNLNNGLTSRTLPRIPKRENIHAA